MLTSSNPCSSYCGCSMISVACIVQRLGGNCQVDRPFTMAITSHGIGDRGPPKSPPSLNPSLRFYNVPLRRSLVICCVLLAFLILLPVCLSATSKPARRPLSSYSTSSSLHARMCPSYEDLDAGSRAYLAPVVFEGKARSKSDVHAGLYRVTFDVVTVYKGDVAANSQVRLEFLSAQIEGGRSKSMLRSSNISAISASSVRSPQRTSNRRLPVLRACVVAADIRTGRRYLVFVNNLGPNNFTAMGSPMIHTKKALKDVRATLCHRCARSPVAVGLEDVTVRSQGRLTLRCRTRGNPLPMMTWFKDGKPLLTSKRIRIKTKRRRSTLRIRCVKEEDAGLYECRPNNVIGVGTSSKSKVTVVKESRLPMSRPGNGSTTLWPLIALPCPIDSFCLNGGTCKYYEAVGELVCQCAEGYKGQRCENKDIYNLGTDSLGIEADMRTLALYLGK